jgi:hypothetical protein
MTSKLMDKENTSGLLHSAKVFKIDKANQFNVDSDNDVKFGTVKQSTTPKIWLDKQQIIRAKLGLTNKQRRALGDVINTTTKATPIKNEAGKLDAQKSTPNVNKREKLNIKSNLNFNNLPHENDLEEPERFIGSKYDSFDDLFESGKLSELFLNKNIKHKPSMPICQTSYSNMNDEFIKIDTKLSKETLKYNKKRIKKMESDDLMQNFDMNMIMQSLSTINEDNLPAPPSLDF